MSGAGPRIGVLDPASSGLADGLRSAGGEPVPLRVPGVFPRGGVALVREWISDNLQVLCAETGVDALVLGAGAPEELAAGVICALRLDLPVVCADRVESPFVLALAAMGVAPLRDDPLEVAVGVARDGRPRASDLVEDFPLANALRAGISLGGGPETLVHLSAMAREARVDGFAQMIRVLAPESRAVSTPESEWFREHGAAGLLAYLGDDLHDVRSLTGDLLEELSPAPPGPDSPPDYRVSFVEARGSGAEAVCTVRGTVIEVTGQCNVFGSEEAAVHAVRWERVDADAFLVVYGCGPCGGPGLIKLQRLADAMREAGFHGPVLTDGLAPDMSPGTWVSVFSPEAAAGGAIGLLRYGDGLRVDLKTGAIRTRVDPEKFEHREPFALGEPEGFGYADRYARSALPALDGAGFD